MLRQWIGALALLLSLSCTAVADITVSGALKKWHPLIIDNNTTWLTLDSSQDQPHPFLDFRYDVSFTSPSGAVYLVPGYFAGDGVGGDVGSVWRAKFSPNEVGEWQYEISFMQGGDLAVSEGLGIALEADGETGTFTIGEHSAEDPGFLALGRLEYTAEHYFKFADGPYFIKGGVDSPENFFGYAGFDNTVNQPGGIHTRGLLDDVHHYEPHVADWQEGDPLFTNSANPEGAKGIIGAINYLASESVNSIYFLPMNLGGDGRETYPFIEASGSHFDNTRYDISKLFQWDIVLNHMQRKGIVAHVVLAETEEGNTDWFDGGQLGFQRKLFYREMIARFSYLMAVKWNLSEESRFGQERHEDFAAYINSLNWANHPIAVHGTADRPFIQYNDIIGNPDFTASSIQFSPDRAGGFVEEWREKTADAGQPWVIDMDEVGPASEGLNPDNIDLLRKTVLYPVYFSGGNIEWYFGRHDLPVGGDLRAEDFRPREQMYRYMKYARQMMQRELPFWEMEPADSLYSGANMGAAAEVFAAAGKAYAVYLPKASAPGRLEVEAGDYRQRWFNPRSGEFVGNDVVVTANDSIDLGAAPENRQEDWVVLLTAANEPAAALGPLVVGGALDWFILLVLGCGVFVRTGYTRRIA